jgi:hypothetical protein
MNNPIINVLLPHSLCNSYDTLKKETSNTQFDINSSLPPFFYSTKFWSSGDLHQRQATDLMHDMAEVLHCSVSFKVDIL